MKYYLHDYWNGSSRIWRWTGTNWELAFHKDKGKEWKALSFWDEDEHPGSTIGFKELSEDDLFVVLL